MANACAVKGGGDAMQVFRAIVAWVELNKAADEFVPLFTVRNAALMLREWREFYGEEMDHPGSHQRATSSHGCRFGHGGIGGVGRGGPGENSHSLGGPTPTLRCQHAIAKVVRKHSQSPSSVVLWLNCGVGMKGGC